MLLPKRLKVILQFLLLLHLLSSACFAVIVSGIGLNREQALNSAFQAAIEAELGVAVNSTAVSENFILIKNEIVTHSKGYVTSYRIINESNDPVNGVTILVEAEVDRKLVTDHTRTLDILMKMAAHPKVIVLGSDEDFDAVPCSTEMFNQLLHVVSQVFQDRFRFTVVDWQAFQARNTDIEGRLNKDLVMRYNHRLSADVMIMVGLNLQEDREEKTAGARLILKGVRISDNHLIGEIYRPVGPFLIRGLSRQKIFHAAVKSAEKEDIFVGAVDLAHKMIEDVERELDRGHGFRYSISFYDFPDSEELKHNLTRLQGYVRHKLASQSNTSIIVTYWSNLRPDDLLQQIRDFLDAGNLNYQTKVDQRVLKFKWKHPDDF